MKQFYLYFIACGLNLNAQTYCAASAVNGMNEHIQNCTLRETATNTILFNNSSGSGRYQDFTSILATITKDTAYSLTLLGTSYDVDQVIVWIDYNQNFVFENGEKVIQTTIGNSPWQGSFNVPTSALLGATRMRIRLHDTLNTPNYTPCGDAGYGEVEDYTVVIQAPLSTVSAAAAKFSIAPNPFQDTMQLSGASEVDTIQVVDSLGRVVKIIDKPSETINLSDLSSGVYALLLYQDAKTVYKIKVVKE